MLRYTYIKSKVKEMKKVVKNIVISIIKAILILVIISITVGLFYLIYIFVVDITTDIPKGLMQTTNINTVQYSNRNVYIVSDKKENSIEKSAENLDFGFNEQIIIYFHGGAYFGEGTTEHWEFIQRVVNDTGATVIFPDYPLAPKYDYIDVYNMVIPLYEDILNQISILEERNGEKIELILMGDSAGGGISLGLIQDLIKENNEIKLPEKTILISPWLDVRMENQEIDNVQKYDNVSNKETLKLAGITYAGENGMNSYLVNPVLGEMTGIENLTIFTGTYDILNPDVHVLEEKAINEKCELEIKEYEKAKHIWFIEQNSGEELNTKGYNDLINIIK